MKKPLYYGAWALLITLFLTLGAALLDMVAGVL